MTFCAALCGATPTAAGWPSASVVLKGAVQPATPARGCGGAFRC